MVGILSMIMINVFLVGTLILTQLAMYSVGEGLAQLARGGRCYLGGCRGPLLKGVCLFVWCFFEFVEGCCQCDGLVQQCYYKLCLPNVT